jgi:hypothetical protein
MVVHFADGRTVRGFSHDFRPTQDRFQLSLADSGDTLEIRLEDLKAIFFVKRFDSDGVIRPRDDIERVGLGPKLRVRFLDGEVLYGFSAAYRPDLKAFAMVPGDPDNNSQQVIVIAGATDSVEYV